MATQIAPTPVVKGQAALKIYQEANQKPNANSRKGTEVLRKKFNGKLK